jgi:hypothetical protein
MLSLCSVERLKLAPHVHSVSISTDVGASNAPLAAMPPKETRPQCFYRVYHKSRVIVDVKAKRKKHCTVYGKAVVVGAGGLPVMSTARALCLMSGGIDSPVAAYQLMTLGCRVDFVHFLNSDVGHRGDPREAASHLRCSCRCCVKWCGCDTSCHSHRSEYLLRSATIRSSPSLPCLGILTL